MVFYGIILSFFAVIDPNSFGLVVLDAYVLTFFNLEDSFVRNNLRYINNTKQA